MVDPSLIFYLVDLGVLTRKTSGHFRTMIVVTTDLPTTTLQKMKVGMEMENLVRDLPGIPQTGEKFL